MAESKAARDLTALTKKIDTAIDATHAGKKVDLRSLDAEAQALSKIIVKSPDAKTLRPAMVTLIARLEMLAALLQDKIAALKSQKK